MHDASMELDGSVYPLHVCAQAGDKSGIMNVSCGVSGTEADFTNFFVLSFNRSLPDEASRRSHWILGASILGGGLM